MFINALGIMNLYIAERLMSKTFGIRLLRKFCTVKMPGYKIHFDNLIIPYNIQIINNRTQSHSI